MTTRKTIIQITMNKLMLL